MSVESFFKDIKKKDFNEVRAFIENGNSPFQWSDYQEKSSFHVACDKFDKEIFEFIIHESLLIEDLKLKWHKVDTNGRYPHHLLALNPPSDEITDAFKLLINNIFIDLEAFDKFEQTVMDIAIENQNEDLINLLNQMDSDPDHGFQKCWKAIELNDLDELQRHFR